MVSVRVGFTAPVDDSFNRIRFILVKDASFWLLSLHLQMTLSCIPCFFVIGHHILPFRLHFTPALRGPVRHPIVF
jgi:hypothetical protein